MYNFSEHGCGTRSSVSTGPHVNYCTDLYSSLVGGSKYGVNAMASNLIAMVSTLAAMASNLLAMASKNKSIIVSVA